MPDTSRGARARSGPGPRGHDGAVGLHGPTAPHHLSRQDWREVLGRVGRLVFVERLPLLSAGIAFFAVLSIAPVLVTALSVYGAVNTPQQALDQLSTMAGMLPPELEGVAADQLTTITTASTQVLTRRGLTALLFALWTATAATSSLIEALSVAYHEKETRSLGRRTGLALLFVLGGALLLGAVIAAAGVVSRSLVGTSDMVRTGAQALVWVGVGALMVGVLAVLYRLGPDRRHARWRWISWGAGGATVLWLLTSAALFAYVQRLGTYESTYGSLAGVAISMFWLWISVLLVLLGAAVNAEVERQTARDSTVGPERPLGERGAVVADSAPPYPRD